MVKISLAVLAEMWFKDYILIHVYGKGARADNPEGQSFDRN